VPAATFLAVIENYSRKLCIVLASSLNLLQNKLKYLSLTRTFSLVGYFITEPEITIVKSLEQSTRRLGGIPTQGEGSVQLTSSLR